MSLIRPIRGLRPASGYANEVIAPPYDVLNTAEAKRRVNKKPWSFLHISKPEIDLAEGIDPYSTRVYAKAAENLQKMLEAKVLIRDKTPCYYAYRIMMGKHQQLGLLAGASIADYNSNRIRKHEFTRPIKEDDRVNQIEAVNAQTGPVLLSYPENAHVDRLLQQSINKSPEIDATDAGVQHTLWLIDDQSSIQALTELFDLMPALYIADGHHRSAAASRVCANRQAQKDDNASCFLSVIFPHHQMKILDYNRVIRDLNGHRFDHLLMKISDKFHVEKVADAMTAKPTQPQQFALYAEKQWYRLNLSERYVPQDDPVARLDVSLLSDHLIEPLLGISDPRRDTRIDFVGGIRGLEALEKRVDSGEMTIAFALYPTQMQDLMSVADANKVMPPKSTWFEPKLADGMVSHVLD